MQITELDFMEGFIRMATDGCNKGWHERNGGNLTYRLKKSESEQARRFFNEAAPWTLLGAEVPELGGEYFLVTGSGKFFRNIERCPAGNIGLCELDESGGSYRVLWGLDNNAKPTSEFLSHLMNHAAKIKAKGAHYRVIYHCHPSNIIAMTFLLPLNEKVFTRELWEMITECSIVFPDGVGVMAWELCGGLEIAEKSAVLMKNYDVIVWAHHGIFCAGEDFDLTFGLADTVEKAAEIWLKITSANKKKLQTITTNNFIELAEAFGVSLPEKFLE
ncbi:MAG: rhamnulose-1-phosphate aldolase [Oscillospiraceae bacterium]|jgi:rhamnulose-1-phosphate aldolase|nr:rhamnulose-1-phosphate aldolase [Oscillospiraceae bacterium]